MKLRAVDISRFTPEDLLYRPQPISSWPTVEVEPSDVEEISSIASWKWDISSSDDVSSSLSECAWDALHLGFTYMFCDVVAIPQSDPNISQALVEFSELYGKLHAVVSYAVDPDLKRAWLRNEGTRILTSPTRLAYICHKWELRVPLI